MTKPAYIIAAKRSAVMPKGGAFARLSIQQLAAPVIQSLLQTSNVDPTKVSELILSNAVGGGGNPARLAALAAGLPEHVGGLSIDRQCTGGLDAIWLAAQMVMSGAQDVIIAGGAESASRRPIRLRTDPDGGDPVAYDRPDFTGITDRDPDMVSAIADLADQRGISRSRQEDWAINSHAKAMQADFTSEMVAIEDQTLDGFTRTLSPQVCQRAKVIEGSITTATTAVDADAAAFVLVVSEDIAKAHPNAIRIDAGVLAAGEPDQPALAPLIAIDRILAKTGHTHRDFQSVEIMEAYAAQAILNAHGFDPQAINKSGGALARGHPIGASGAILGVRLYHELQNIGGMGLATIAAAGGLGSALILSGPNL